MPSRLNQLLYVVCAVTDFAAFIVVFAVSRGLAEAKVESLYLGIVGAGYAFSAGVGSLLGGWLAHRFDGRVIFVAGAVLANLSIAACGLIDLESVWFLPGYCLMGVGLGFQYPPLIGWLNQSEDAHANHRGVSRTLILFCVAWNLGMMCGQFTAGWLFFELGSEWAYRVAFLGSLVNLALALAAIRWVVPLSAADEDMPTPEYHALRRAAAYKRLSWVANLGGMFGGSLVIHLLPDLAVLIGVPSDRHGMLLACWRVAVIATYLLMHHFAFWHYRLAPSLGSQLLAAIGLIVIANADSAITLLIGLALLGQLVGYNYFSGLFYATTGSPHDGRALAAGLHEATLAGGMAIGTLAGGLAGTLFDPRVPYLLAAAAIVILVLVQLAAWYKWIGADPIAAAAEETPSQASVT